MKSQLSACHDILMNEGKVITKARAKELLLTSTGFCMTRGETVEDIFRKMEKIDLIATDSNHIFVKDW